MKTLIAVATVLVAVAGAASAHQLPLGDGKVSTSPRKGYVFSCQTRFPANAPGAHAAGPWISGDSYDPARKPTVDGAASWPASLTISLEGGNRVIRANSLPRHATGNFPITSSDDAYNYDRNPNRIREQPVVMRLPVVPSTATPSCVPMGMIGFALTGTAIFNALDAGGRDAPAHEIQDRCNGHPERNGQYHYHDASPCLTDSHGQPGGHSDVIGYALDGFGIFGLRGEGGKTVVNADLDACHGHTHEVVWDGGKRAIYHYHLTAEYPYTIGCFMGKPVAQPVRQAGPPERGPPPGMRLPPSGGPRPPWRQN